MPWKDKEVERARRRALYWANIEARRERNRLDSLLFRQRHPDKVKAQNDSYRERNLEEERERSRLAQQQRRQEHPEEAKAYSRAYRANNPDKRGLYNKTYSANKRGALLNDLSHAQWLEIQVAQDYRCYYCGKRCKSKLTQDHIIPLSKGGSHTLHNVIGACKSCNSKKRAGPPLKPVQPLLLSIAASKKKKAS